MKQFHARRSRVTLNIFLDRGRSMWRKIAWPTAGILLAALVSAAIPAAQAATGCRVDYTVQSQWIGGFQAAVTVQNLGEALNGWALTFTFPRADQRLTQGWNATW